MSEVIENKNALVAPGRLLAIAALLGTGLMVIINGHTKPYIAENEKQVLLRTLNEVVPANTYDNDILNDTIFVNDKNLLGSNKPIIIYRARKQNQPVASIIKVIAPKGYSGPIELLVGISSTQRITGVRVIKHQETPGLGDGIEKQRSNWIDLFIGKAASNPIQTQWKVTRDGGDFDQLTGATITPRAIVRAVYNALLYVEENHKLIFDKNE